METFSWQEPVKTNDLTTAPNTPSKGDRYIVPAAVTPGDIWESHENAISWYDGAVWKFDAPDPGWSCFIEAQLLNYTWNGTEWGVAEAGAIVTKEIWIDKNRTDTYPANGSKSLPYKTIVAAIDSIVNAGDNSHEVAYRVNLSPALYEEPIVLNNAQLVNLIFTGAGKTGTILRPATGDGISSTLNNDNLLNLFFEDMTIDAPITLTGASNDTNFTNLVFYDVGLTSNAATTLTNVLSAFFVGNTDIKGDLIINNVALINVSNESGIVDATKALSFFGDIAMDSPNGFTGVNFYQSGNINERTPTWNIIDGTTGKLVLLSSILGSNDDENIIIPLDVTYEAINSTMLGNYKYIGDLKLKGSFVTGTFDPTSTGELEMRVQSGDQIVMGLPPDGALSDGILDIKETTPIVNVLDEFNELMNDLAPPQADPLTNVALAGTRTLRSGLLPSGLDTRWYQDGKVAGNSLVNVIEYDNLILSNGTGAPNDFAPPGTVPVTPDTSNSAQFRKGDQGLLIAKFNDGGAGLAVVATLDIEANFEENPPGTSPPRPPTQTLANWDYQGTGDPVTDGTVTFSNSKGNLQVTDVRWFNDFNRWQKMNALFNITALDEGFNSFTMLHAMPGGNEESAEYKLFYDDSIADTLSFATAPTIVENTLASNKYLSGIRYYSTGDSFDINYVGSNVFKKIYHSSYVSRFRFEGLDNNAYQIRNPQSVPVFTDTFTVNETIAINRSSYYDLNSILQAYLYHPYKASVNASTPNENRIVNTYGNVSTDTIEYFRDENHRLPDGSYDTAQTQGDLIGKWDSSQALVAGNALFYNEAVQMADINLSGTLPAGNPDLRRATTGRTGNEVFVRGFYSSSANSGFTLKLAGLVLSDVGQVGQGNVNVEVKLPGGETGWLDAGKAFSGATFAGLDGDGCQTSVSGSDFTITFGTKSTANSNGVIIVRITFRVSGKSITEMRALSF
jgi:hypothetical protein